MNKMKAFNRFRQRYNMQIFFMITLLQYLAANFAHPFTPTLIQDLGLKDYMFGLMFAAMSFTNFLFSPFWGKMREYFSARGLLFIGCLGYAGGQFLFSISKTMPIILLARCTSGVFVGAISVSTLVYATDHGVTDRAGENLAKLAILQSLGAAFGYLIGGVLGSRSIPFTFSLQVAVLALCGILYGTLLTKDQEETHESVHLKMLLKEANPLKAFSSCRAFMTVSFALLFLAVLFANLGTFAFDQCFNYYLKDQFQLSSRYNGLIKAIIGVITLIANTSICMRIMKRKNIKRPTAWIMLCGAASIFFMLQAVRLPAFVTICIAFFTFNAIYIPLLQDSVARESTKKNNLVMGFYNAVKSMGMIGGALVAGFIYSYGAKLPFVFAGICFVLAAVFLLIKPLGAVNRVVKSKR